MATDYRPSLPASGPVLLDMDGTLLDLAFDNHFWLQALPERHAREQGRSLAAARQDLQQRMRAVEGRLEWYCTDYWSRQLGFDVIALKQQMRDRIRMLPGAADFLHRLRAGGRPTHLVTNAHPRVLDLKLRQTGLDRQVTRIFSAHEFGAAKESPRFWRSLETELGPLRDKACFIDDSPAVLGSARAYGLPSVIGIRQPDSTQTPRPLDGFMAVDGVGDLITPYFSPPDESSSGTA